MVFDFKRALRGQAEGKAIPAHPALLTRDPITIYSPGANSGDGRPRISQREAPRHINAYGGSEDAIDWVMDAVKLYERAAGASEWHLERKGKKVWLERQEETPDSAEVLNDPILKTLMEMPNPYMAWSELVKRLVVDLLLVGNAYWYKWRQTEDCKPLALYPLSPSYVKVIPGALGVAAYEYQPPNVKDPQVYQPEQVVHFKLTNPHSPYWGLGVIQGGARPLDLELALTESQASYHERKAEPSVIVQSDRRVPKDVMNKLRLQLRARSSGPKNSGELMVLEAGLKAMTLSPNAAQQMYDTLSNLSRDRVLAMFQVSPKLLGIATQFGGQDKTTDVRREFDTYVAKPFLKDLAEKMSLSLFQPWDVDFHFDYNYVLPHEDLVKNGSSLAAIPGIKVKELRRFLLPLGVLDGESTGDPKIDELVLNLPTPELDANGQPINPADVTGKADRNLAGEAGRPPNGSNTVVAQPGQPVPKGVAARAPSQKAFTSIEDIEETLRRAEAKAMLPNEKRPEDVAESDRDSAINDAAAAMIPELRQAATTLERFLLDHVEGKALTDKLRKSEGWNAFMTLITSAIEKGAVRAASAAAIHQGTRGLVPEDDLDYEAIAREVVFRKDGVRGITDTLKKEIVQKVAQAQREHKDRTEIEQIIREAVDFWRQSKAETVALTEAVHAYNESTLSIAEATGHSQVMVTDGRDDDQPCVEADGSIWDIDHARQHRLEHPRCRRAFIPLAPAVSF
jgi:HK97 family phage portal protein